MRKPLLCTVAGVLALGLAAGGCGKEKEPAERWLPFQFRAGQYFKYSLALSEEGGTKKGWFSLELKPAGAGQVEAIWEGELDGGRFSFRQTGPTETVANPASIMIAAATSGSPVAVPLLTVASSTVFAPWYASAFADHPLAVGSGWEFRQPDGTYMSVKVVDRCREVGLPGSLVRLEAGEGGRSETVMESCISGRSPLALSTRIREQGRLRYEVVLQEQRGL